MTAMSCPHPKAPHHRGTEIWRSAETMHFSTAEPAEEKRTNRYVNFCGNECEPCPVQQDLTLNGYTRHQEDENMSWWLLLCTLAVWVLASAAATENRKVHRLVGGHLRIFQDSLDSELLEALASGSKGKKSQKGEDEEKKTLSQQVADGKYGLIQKELFTKPSKRPGVLSYESNPEVPKDNIGNLGGLTKNDIWLAENHLLVLKGGTYPPHDDKNDNGAASVWPAIDDYKAPSRQVKIPAHPKVPPPFPVQLSDDGPLQILGTNSSRTINGTLEQATFALPPPEGFDASPYLPPGYPYPANVTPGQAPYPVPALPSGEYLPGAPFPPYNLNGTLPPFFASLPPGAAILPPPNLTEPFDEDDPSIYYPPPYSFYYPKDNSSLVPAGPLVPGIVLPPPPNFFGPLEETTKTPSTTTRKANRMRIKMTTTTPLPQIHPTTTEIPPTSVLDDKTTKKPVRIFPVHIPAEINNELKPIVTTTPPKVVTVLSIRPTKNKTTPRMHKPRPPTVTVLKPVKPNEGSQVYAYENEVPGVYRTPARPKTLVSTTQVPLKVYYTTSNDIETNSITHAPEKYRISVTRRTKPTTKSPAQYYYYEEPIRELTTRKPFYDIPKEYYLPSKQSNPTVQQQKFIYVPNRPYNTQRPRYRFVQTPKTDTFSIHIARLQKQIHQYYTTARPRQTHSPKPVYQFSFEAANYRPQRPPQDDQDRFRPLPKYSVQIQPAIEIIPTQNTPPPNYYRVTTERPIASKYYQTPRPDYDYEDDVKNTATPRPYQVNVTPNPVYQGFYTKPDEGFFDENTRHYFTTFGQKLQSATTPLPQSSSQRQRYQQKPINLEGDTAVNYLPPRPNVNPDAEFVPVNPNGQRVNYPPVVKYGPKPAQYAQESRQQNRGPEIVKAMPVAAEGQPGSFISYQLPGDDGAHFYFLTPQLAQSRDQGAGYYYSQPNAARVRRNGKR